MPLTRARLLIPLLLLLPACPGNQTSSESGAAQCNDGVDNDNDGRIDCKDPDCYPLAICSPVDSRVLDVGSGDGPRPPDLGPVTDVAPPTPDLPLVSSYGKRCQYTSQGTPCPDGQTECVPGKYGSPGLCTQSCNQGGSCPAGPAGTKVHCGYEVAWPQGSTWYCLFTCQSGEPCPNDTQCYYGTFCF